MAVPSSGSLSLFGIAKEVHLDNYNNTVPAPGSGGTNWSQLGYPSISLGNMSTGAGGFDAINSASSSKPNGATPHSMSCLLYTSPSPRDGLLSRMPSSA